MQIDIHVLCAVLAAACISMICIAKRLWIYLECLISLSNSSCIFLCIAQQYLYFLTHLCFLKKWELQIREFTDIKLSMYWMSGWENLKKGRTSWWGQGQLQVGHGNWLNDGLLASSLVLLLPSKRYQPELQVCAGCRAHAIVTSTWWQPQGSTRGNQSSHQIHANGLAAAR